MTRLFMGCTFTGEFLRGYSKAKMAKEFNIPVSYGQYQTNGRDLYLGLTISVTGYLDYDLKNHKEINKKTFNKKEFEEYYQKDIKKEITYMLTSLIEIENRKISKLEISKTNLMERNKHNFSLKKTPSYFQSRYMNKYYVYNAGIHQIINVYTYEKAQHISIELPSGRVTSIKMSSKELKEKESKLFIKRKDAETYLLNVWIKENEVPKFREKEIDALVKSQFNIS